MNETQQTTAMTNKPKITRYENRFGNRSYTGVSITNGQRTMLVTPERGRFRAWWSDALKGVTYNTEEAALNYAINQVTRTAAN